MKDIINKALCLLHWISKYDYFNRTLQWGEEYRNLKIKYMEFIKANSSMKYQVEWIDIDKKGEHMFVGGQYAQEVYWGIPCNADFVLKFEVYSKKIEFIRNVYKAQFKYTGGCNIGDKIYCFPRTENNILSISILDGKNKNIDMRTDYNSEHHYGGVCIEKRLILQPPRLCNVLLQYDILTNETTKIKMSHIIKHFKYCGSIYHPNGCVYFLPEACGPVIKYYVAQKKWKYIGIPVSAMVYDAKVCTDGNIYGFSAKKGIIKINVENNKVKILYKNIEFGAYGTKLGINGKIYSIPGRGNGIWSYDPVKNILEKEWGLLDSTITCAGGVTTNQGVIIGSPCCEDKILVITPEEKVNIPLDIYEAFYKDCY